MSDLETEDQERKSKEEFIKESESEAEVLRIKAREILQEAKKIKMELGQDVLDQLSEDLPGLEDLDIGNNANGSGISGRKNGDNSFLASVKLRAPRLKQYSKGGNFSRFCERFMEYVHIAKIEDPDLYMLFLQNMDDETYSILKTVQLSTSQKGNAKTFCDMYKAAIYGDEEVTLRTDLMRCRQDSEEDITTYAFRLREKANIAYTDNEMGEENCLLVFLQNVKDDEMRKKLNEASFQNFSEAIKQAKKIESAAKIGSSKQFASILKQTSFQDTVQESAERGRPLEWETRRDSMSNSRDRRSQSNGSGRTLSQERSESRGDRRGMERDSWNNSQRGGRTRTFDDRNIVCFNCNRRGHRRINCRAGGNGLGREQVSHNYRNFANNGNNWSNGRARFGAPLNQFGNGYSRNNFNNGHRMSFNNNNNNRGYNNNNNNNRGNRYHVNGRNGQNLN